MDENILIGLKKRFHYENKDTINDRERNNNVSWIMFEYCLAGSLKNNSTPSTGTGHDYVLCPIWKKQ